MKCLIVVPLLLLSLTSFSQTKPFRFAFLSDTHIGSPNGGAEEDLRKAIADINAMHDVDFVVLTGDITELGTNQQLQLAKRILDSLKIPYYIIPGNHDTGWSESGGIAFTTTFGDDKFVFDHNGIRFIGCASGPYVRMSDGHVPRSAINWLSNILKQTSASQPIIFLNHYPIDSSLDNWYEVTDLLKQKNIAGILCGHGHANKAMMFESIPATMGRSNLRAKAKIGGINIVDVRNDSMIFYEKKHGQDLQMQWRSFKMGKQNESTTYVRPSYAVNTTYPQVKEKWRYASDANIISSPAVAEGIVVAGNQDGLLQAFDINSGKLKWIFKAGAAIYSTPAVFKNSIVFGSADSNVYCVSTTGKQLWKYKTGAAVLGSPLINNDTVFIGGSDHSYRALSLKTGKQLWQYDQLNGPVVSTPLLHNGLIIFGAWDNYLYALQSSTGKLEWKWTNGSTVANFSPASCIPVAKDSIIYIVAPDRYLTAINVNSGTALWRTNEFTVRESIGISADGSLVFAKTMNDTIVAFKTGATKQLAWKLNAGFGYEHVPSMLTEKQGNVFFGTRNGVVYAIDKKGTKVLWAHKIDNSMVNTVVPIDSSHILVTTMDGKLVYLVVEIEH